MEGESTNTETRSLDLSMSLSAEVNRLRADIRALKDKLVEQEEEANDVISQWQESYALLEETNYELSADYQSAMKRLEELDLPDTDTDGTRDIDALKLHISQLETDLASSQSGLEKKHQISASEEELRVTLELERTQADGLREKIIFLESHISAQEDVVKDLKGEVTELGSEIESLKNELADQDREAQEAVNAWQESYGELQKEMEETANHKELAEAEVSLLKSSLGEAQEEIKRISASVVKSGDTSDIVLRLNADLDRERKAREAAEERLERIRKELEHIQEESRNLISEELSLKEKTISELRSSLDLAKSDVGELTKERETLRLQVATVENENERLAVQVSELSDELREITHTLHSRVTNEHTIRSIEAAAQAMRAELEDVQEALSEAEHQLEDERRQRIESEKECESLRDDLGAILGMSGDSFTSSRLRGVEAREAFQNQQKAEIENLKWSLQQSIDGLEATRRNEEILLAKLNEAELQITVYEQEILSLKSDLQFMTESLDEIRESESTRRGALEYKISCLESNKKVVARLHRNEVERLSNELHQLGMEKDKLFQSLKESERQNAAFIATSNENSSVEASLETENTRLRIEKTELLSRLAEQGSRFEKRLREAIAAEHSSREAETLIERELRIKEEKRVARLEEEIRKLEQHIQDVPENEHEAISRLNTTTEIENEINELSDKVQQLSTENTELRILLEKQKRDDRNTIEKLKEECRIARARASENNQNSRLEAEIRAEMARLHATSEVASSKLMVVRNENSDPSQEEATNSAIAATFYDTLQKQKRMIEDERKAYHELLAEHDELLALLAQHDLLRGVLKEALLEVGGQCAIDQAMLMAESKAQEKYGTCVTFS